MLQVMDLDNSAKSVKEKVVYPKKSLLPCARCNGDILFMDLSYE